MNLLIPYVNIINILVVSLSVLIGILWTFKRPSLKYFTYIKFQIFAIVYIILTCYIKFLEYATDQGKQISDSISVLVVLLYLSGLVVVSIIIGAIKIRNRIPDPEGK